MKKNIAFPSNEVNTFNGPIALILFNNSLKIVSY